MNKMFFRLIIGALCFSFLGIAPARAESDPTVSITSPTSGTVAKGVLSITSQFAADPSGTATISRIGVTIAGAPSGYYSLLSLGGYTSSASTLGSTNVDAAWSSSYWNGSSATFRVDTTAWPAGTYSVSVTAIDSNGRTTTSSPVSFVIPKAVTILTNFVSYDGEQAVITATIPGITDLGGGQVQLLASDSPDGQYSLIGTFTGTPAKLTFSGPVQISKWIKAALTESPTLLDSFSKPTQVLAVPKINCSIASKAKVMSKINGSCQFTFPVNGAKVILGVNTGKGWKSLGSGTANGKTFPFSVVGKVVGKLQVQIVSAGTPGVYQAFTSRVMSIQITKK